jgi:chorismate mutase/prephenate dehydratase
MKKLESRPMPSKPWEHLFYVDIDVPDKIDIFYECLEELRKETEELKILGIYGI